MSTAVPTVGGNSPAIPPAASPTLASDWHYRLSKGDGNSFIHWRLANNDSLEIVQSSAEVDKSFRSRSNELAEVAIRTGQRQTCVLASPTASIVIAEPIPALGSDCLCVRFPCELSKLTEEAVAQRAAIVTDAALTIVAEAPLRRPLSASPPSFNPSTEPPQGLPSWPELASLFKKKLLTWLAQPKSNSKIYVGIVGAIVGVCLLPWPHSIKCKVVCEPKLRRYVAAPFDAKLLQAHVVVGQQVQQGDLLATLDGGDLLSHLASVRAKLAQAEQRELAALSTGDHSKSGFERLEVEHLRREAELLQRRQANLELRSPIDGVVVSGDLEREQGTPLSLGVNLFEIARLDNLIAEVAIPEQDVNWVKNEMPVSIVMEAMAGTRLESTIQRIHLRSEIRDNASVFIAEAELPNPDAWLRPGMNARAKIDAGYRAIGWQLFRSPFNAARQWIGW
jgi:biotin carboxyl carrier protein